MHRLVFHHKRGLNRLWMIQTLRDRLRSGGYAAKDGNTSPRILLFVGDLHQQGQYGGLLRGVSIRFYEWFF